MNRRSAVQAYTTLVEHFNGEHGTDLSDRMANRGFSIEAPRISDAAGGPYRQVKWAMAWINHMYYCRNLRHDSSCTPGPEPDWKNIGLVGGDQNVSRTRAKNYFGPDWKPRKANKTVAQKWHAAQREKRRCPECKLYRQDPGKMKFAFHCRCQKEAQ